MNRQAQGVVLMLLGGAIIKATVFSDLYLRYVKQSLFPFLVGAGVVLLVAAVMTIVYDLRHGSTVDTECADDHGDEHGHDHSVGAKPHKEPQIGWLLILPVLGLLLVAPPALGAYAANQSGTALSAQQAAADYPELPPGNPAKISVMDYAIRATFDRGLSIGDREVQLTGFLTQGPDGQMLVRMMLSCCAADGRPIKVAMTGDRPTGLADDQWVEIVGKYSSKFVKDPVNDFDIPYIEVVSWRPIDPPAQQYE